MEESILKHCKNGIKEHKLATKLIEEGFNIGSNPRESLQLRSILERLVDVGELFMVEYLDEKRRRCYFYISSERVLVVKGV